MGAVSCNPWYGDCLSVWVTDKTVCVCVWGGDVPLVSFSGMFLFKFPTSLISGVDVCVGVLWVYVDGVCLWGCVKTPLWCGCCRRDLTDTCELLVLVHECASPVRVMWS